MLHGGAIMRGRHRRNTQHYFSAALLELIILATFVVIAQPQFRQGLMEIVQPATPAPTLPVQQTRLAEPVYRTPIDRHSAPTPLLANEWNVAAAAQSPRPLSGWLPVQAAETAYRETYPPPYGTQSPWQ